MRAFVRRSPETQVLRGFGTSTDRTSFFFLFFFPPQIAVVDGQGFSFFGFRPKLRRRRTGFFFFFRPKLPSSTDRVVFFFFFPALNCRRRWTDTH